MLTRQRVDRSSSHGATAPATADNKEWNAALGRKGMLGLGSPDKADGNADDGGRKWRAFVEHFEQPKQRGRRIADSDNSSLKTRPPKFQRRRRSGVSDFSGERHHSGIVQGADDTVVVRQSAAGDAVGDHLRITQDRRAAQ